MVVKPPVFVGLIDVMNVVGAGGGNMVVSVSTGAAMPELELREGRT
jgi:hypothetical protein